MFYGQLKNKQLKKYKLTLKDGVMDRVWKKVLRIISTFVLAISFLCCSSIDVSAGNEVTMLVCGDNKMESMKAFETLYTHLTGGVGLALVRSPDFDRCIGIRCSLNMDDVSADLSATLNMYYVEDVQTPQELLIPSDLLVLVYAGKEAKGLGNLPQLQKELKRRKHRVELPEMVLLNLNEVLVSQKKGKGVGCCCGCFGTSIYNEDEEDKGGTGYALNLIKACGNMWPRCPIEKERSFPELD
jgi:hypothetical protein